MRELGLRPTADLFGELDKSDIIEIYSEEHIQLFRTFNMFECISYSLDELFSYEWWDLFQRDPAITEQLTQVAISLATAAF
ncbi:MAG: hypothetical protein HC902_03040 [Calothrix sp. SM1_5_4]|nr:hypothetical protein [Calothrix sp. SM1_5_4]